MKNLEKKGFSLAELLLCIAIIGVVSAMGMTITKHSSDKAYNLYYYTGYINLYNAIADAKASGRSGATNIMNHVNEVMKKEDEVNVAFNNQKFDIISAKAYLSERDYYVENDPGKVSGEDFSYREDRTENSFQIGGGTTGGGGGTGGGSGNNNNQVDKIPGIGDDHLIPFNPNLPGSGDNGDNSGDNSGNTSGGNLNGGSEGNKGNGSSGSWNNFDFSKINWPDISINPDNEEGDPDGGAENPDGAYEIIETSNGVDYCYLNGNEDSFGIVMRIPQRKTRTNNGTASVRFVFVDINGGYLIPVSNDSDVDLQTRRDLLPAYIDNGKVGRNNVLNRNQGFTYQPIRYASYKEAFCTVERTVDGLIDCGEVQQITPDSGILKVADPRKAR